MRYRAAALCLVNCLLAAEVSMLIAQEAPGGPSPQGQEQKASPMLLPQAVVLPRTEEVVVDGSLSEWPSLPVIVLSDRRQLSGTAPGAWNGPRDFTAMAFLMWDTQHLYVAVQVRDEWHRALDQATLRLSEIPLADSILLTFDPERNTRSSGPDEGRREDREFWLADEAARQVVLWDRLRGEARVLDGDAARAVCLHDKEQGVTTYEAKLPWHEILPPGFAVEAGLVLDFEIVANDYDESTDPMPQTRIGWTFGCGSVIDPGLFGSIMLVGDGSALQGQMPEFPPKPAAGSDPLGPAEQWDDLAARLGRLPPAVHDGTAAPELAGGLQRLKVLEEIDRHCAAYPRVDCLEFHGRIHRRMNREVAGIRGRGLPYWWSTRLQSLSKAAEAPVPAGTVRLFRIPMGGWLVGISGGGLAIDPAGADLAEWLWGRMGFVILTQPLDATRRNDQLLLRMMNAEPPRPVLTHIAFHLPVVTMRETPLVAPGTDCSPPSGMKLRALGKVLKDGSVMPSCSYRIEFDEGPRILVVAPALKVDEVTGKPVDLMILSPRNPDLLKIVDKVKPGMIVIDDVFLCQSRPDMARIGLGNAHALQKALQPHESVVLAPGEAWDVTRGK